MPRLRMACARRVHWWACYYCHISAHRGETQYSSGFQGSPETPIFPRNENAPRRYSVGGLNHQVLTHLEASMRNAPRSKSTTPRPVQARNALLHLEIPDRRADGSRILNRPALRAVLLALASHADHDTGSGARPSLATLGAASQISPRTVQRALVTLSGLGILRRTRAHSWKLHRPTTWSIVPGVLRQARAAAMEAVRVRSARYWERLRAWERLRSPSGRQGVRLPSPLQGERRLGSQGESGKAPPGSLLDILQHLQNRDRGLSAT